MCAFKNVRISILRHVTLNDGIYCTYSLIFQSPDNNLNYNLSMYRINVSRKEQENT